MSTEAHWKRLDELFDAAMDVPDRERAGWLHAHVPDDAELRAELERMLDAHRRTGGILDRSVAELTPDALQARLARALAGRYALDRELGDGGSATVFLAHEHKHARRVVLKVLKPHVASWYGTERFVREVRISARLAHPHIVPLIDSGDANGLLYYVMPHVAGETLRDRLRRERLPLGTALTFMRDVASALAHAHAAGVVHRDLKPENVLCAGEHAFLLDFGIAKSMATGEDLDASLGGARLGTPMYMAPEQRAGGHDLDERVDVWAWGLIACEMLTGTIPAGGRAAEHLRTRAPDAPPRLTSLILDCLTPHPDDRVANGGDLFARLAGIDAARPSEGVRAMASARRWRRATAGIAVAIPVMALAAWLLIGRTAAGAAVPGPVAVLALRNETGDSALAPWGRLAGDWITQGIQETGAAAVVPWPTALAASERVEQAISRGERVDPVRSAAEETGARAVVTGSYYRTGDSLRFNVMMTDVRQRKLIGAPAPVVVAIDSAHLAIRDLRDRLMGAVAVWSADRPPPGDDASRRPPTFAAYRSYDAALRHFLDQEYAEAAPRFLEAYREDSTFTPALLYAATAYWNTGAFASEDSVIRVLRARDRSLGAFDRGWLDFLEASLAGDGERALTAIRIAADAAGPSRATYNLAELALDMDRPEEALAALEKLDPDRGDMRGWSSYWTQLTYAHHLLGDHQRELAAARQMRVRFPDRRVGIVLEARALAAAGRLRELDSLQAWQASLPTGVYWSQGASLVVSGEELIAHGRAPEGTQRLDSAVAWFEEQLRFDPTSRVHRYWLGSALYDLGRWKQAEDVFVPLAAEFPDRIQYRGMAALSGARTGRPRAELRLGAPAPRDRGEHLAFLARLSAVRSDRERAVSQFGEAVRIRMNDLPWLHASAYQDLVLLRPVRDALPHSLVIADSRR